MSRRAPAPSVRPRARGAAAGLRRRWLAALCGLAAALSLAEAAAGPPAPPATAAADAVDAAALIAFDSVPGIPRGVVAALAQDRRGFIWVATGDGLMRWDGHALRPLERDDPDPAARSLGWVRALLGHGDGSLWIGTESAGVWVHDPASGALRPLPLPAPAANGHWPTVGALAEGPGGRVWIGFDDGSLAWADPGGAAARVPSPLAGAPVAALRVDADGRLWAGGERGLWRASGGSAALPAFEALRLDGQAARVGALALAPDGAVWVGTADGRVWRIGERGQGLPQAVGAGATAVTGIVFDGPAPAPARAWVGRRNGIDLHALDGRRLHALRPERGMAYGLAGGDISALLREHGGEVWVGSLGGGLQRYRAPTPGLSVRLTQPLPGPQGRGVEPDLRALLVWPDGSLWAGLHGGGIAEFDAGLTTLRALHAPALRVEAMAMAATGGAWVAGAGQLHRLAANGRASAPRLRGLPAVNHLLDEPGGALWLATRAGLLAWTAGEGAPRAARTVTGAAVAGDAFVLTRGPDGSLWAGTAAGLWRRPAAASGAGGWQRVVSPAGAGLGNPIVAGLQFDAGGALWVDTAVTGLHRAAAPLAAAAGPAGDGSTWPVAFEPISQRHGRLARPFGANLLVAASGRVWTHMHVYDPATDRLTELGAPDGVRIGTGWFGSRAVAADGRLLFGGSRGLLVVDDAAWAPQPRTAPLVLTALYVDGRPRAAGEGLVLAAGERSFSVEFAALAYGDKMRLRYAWTLDGHDARWTEGAVGQRAAAWGKIPPGRYRLRVRATDAGGAWAGDELSLPVRVQPAWWQRRDVRSLAVAAALLAVLGSVYAYTAGLRRRQRHLEAVVRRRTAELERLNAVLHEASRTDPLTGLHNRRHLLQHIDDDVAASRRRHDEANERRAPPPEDADLLLLLVDLDHFKRLNDEHDHATGDAVLAQMRARLLGVCRADDHVVRWGGEEFLVVARGSPRGQAPALAERLRRAVADQAFTDPDGQALHCTCSVGFAAFPADPRAPQALDWAATLRLADAALLAAKRGGRNRWCGVVELPGANAQRARQLAQALAAGGQDAAAHLASGPDGHAVASAWTAATPDADPRRA